MAVRNPHDTEHRDEAARRIAADPIGLEILWTRLIAIADEAATTLVRTSFSPIVRESNDYSCAIFNRIGETVAENTIGIPSFNVTMQRTLQELIRRRGYDSWAPGDVIITNDPWLCTGHLPDITMFMPIFLGQELVGWAGSIAHMADIGGAGWRADTRDVYEEGIFLPPTYFFRAGERNEELIELLSYNVRLPDEVIGDLMAMRAAVGTAADQLLSLMGELGLADLKIVSEEIFSRAEAAMRKAIAAVPDGVYRSTVDMDGTGEEPIQLSVTVTVAEDTLNIDYAGTSPQVAKALNTVMNYTEAYSAYPVKCALDPDTPRNAGSYRSVTVTAPKGSILNPEFPAAVNARQIVGHVLSAVLYEALVDVLPNQVIAESGSAPTLRVVITGARADASRFSSILFVSGGMGARPKMDGLSGTCFPSMVVCGSMEALEVNAPIRVWRKELAENTGGAGRYRGGLGQSVRLELLGDRPAMLSLFVDRVEHPARGLKGGLPGGASAVWVNGEKDGFPLKGRSALKPGDVIDVRYPGGGGFGPPGERSPEALAADVESGLVSAELAKEVYGR
jgi:N-methylhydantoinase B